MGRAPAASVTKTSSPVSNASFVWTQRNLEDRAKKNRLVLSGDTIQTNKKSVHLTFCPVWIVFVFKRSQTHFSELHISLDQDNLESLA